MHEELELTDEMNARNDEIDNGVYETILMLTEKTNDELGWDMEIIGTVTDVIVSVLWQRFKLKVRHPGVVTNEDGSQYISEYEYDEEQL
jgi:hypothetical protein